MRWALPVRETMVQLYTDETPSPARAHIRGYHNDYCNLHSTNYSMTQRIDSL